MVCIHVKGLGGSCMLLFPRLTALIVALYGVRSIFGAPYNTRIYDAFTCQITVGCNYDCSPCTLGKLGLTEIVLPNIASWL